MSIIDDIAQAIDELGAEHAPLWGDGAFDAGARIEANRVAVQEIGREITAGTTSHGPTFLVIPDKDGMVGRIEGVPVIINPKPDVVSPWFRVSFDERLAAQWVG